MDVKFQHKFKCIEEAIEDLNLVLVDANPPINFDASLGENLSTHLVLGADNSVAEIDDKIRRHSQWRLVKNRVIAATKADNCMVKHEPGTICHVHATGHGRDIGLRICNLFPEQKEFPVKVHNDSVGDILIPKSIDLFAVPNFMTMTWLNEQNKSSNQNEVNLHDFTKRLNHQLSPNTSAQVAAAPFAARPLRGLASRCATRGPERSRVRPSWLRRSFSSRQQRLRVFADPKTYHTLRHFF
jgi:hypothetical protein